MRLTTAESFPSADIGGGSWNGWCLSLLADCGVLCLNCSEYWITGSSLDYWCITGCGVLYLNCIEYWITSSSLDYWCITDSGVR